MSATVQCVVVGGPDGDVKGYFVLDDGKLVDTQLGSRAEPDITLTIQHPDALGLQQGEADPNVLFMQGRMKTAGDPGKLLELLRLTKEPENRAVQDAIGSIVEP